jgi:rhodanese-related sulfurtransferase
MKYYFRIILISLILTHSFRVAQAVPPPDFIFNVWGQVVQIFTFLVVGLSAVVALIKKFFETSPFYNKHKTIFWVLVALIVIGLSIGGAYAYSAYKQKAEYSKWLEESKMHSQTTTPSFTPSTNVSPTKSLEGPATSSVLSFYDQNSSLAESIPNEEFQNIPQAAYILDAREDEEYENGYYPGNHHIRAADVIDGAWTTLPTDQPIYVICWSGIRGKEVADFLRAKKILARYLEKGADGWVSFGGKWNGAIKFRSVYTDKKYEIVFSTDEVKRYVSQGAVLVDSRPKEKYDYKHIPQSVSIPLIYTPSNKMEQVLSQVPIGSTVITVCDDFVSCFDATIAGVKFEKRGDTFLGRYNKPWDY